jgi:hypothetical protein
MTISGRYIDADSYIIVDGRRVPGKVELKGDEVLIVELTANPTAGMHLLQLQTPGGLISNDFIFHVTETPQPAPRPTLGEIVENGGWNTLLGDWVDVGTRGEFRLSLNWKIKNQLLELTTIDQNGTVCFSDSCRSLKAIRLFTQERTMSALQQAASGILQRRRGPSLQQAL